MEAGSRDKTLADYGLRAYHGMLWYRVTIQLAPNHGPVGLRLADTYTSYQVFANGRQVAEYGGMPPRGARYNSAPQTFSLQVAPETTSVVLAIRVWANTITATPGLSANGILIGDASAIQKEQKLIQAQNVYDYSPLAIDGAVTFLFGVLLLMLYLAQRDHLEYLWLGASNVVGAFAGGLGLIQGAGFLPVSWQYRVGIPLQVIAGVLQIEFLFSFVGVKPNRWVRGFQAFILLFGFSFIVTYGYMNPAVNAFTQGIVAILIGSLGLLFILLLARLVYPRQSRSRVAADPNSDHLRCIFHRCRKQPGLLSSLEERPHQRVAADPLWACPRCSWHPDRFAIFHGDPADHWPTFCPRQPGAGTLRRRTGSRQGRAVADDSEHEH